jgi:hypothetical protein
VIYEAAPYADLVGEQDPLTLLGSTPLRIAELVRGFDRSRWASSYAPGKWTAAQLVLHLAQDEIGWCNRIRLALSVEGYVVQPYEGDRWVELESPADPAAALDAFLALRRLNLALYAHITPEQCARTFRHPEAGNISIEWILRTLAGHDLHHLRHLQAIASR